jgi:hypothetical protein
MHIHAHHVYFKTEYHAVMHKNQEFRKLSPESNNAFLEFRTTFALQIKGSFTSVPQLVALLPHLAQLERSSYKQHKRQNKPPQHSFRRQISGTGKRCGTLTQQPMPRQRPSAHTPAPWHQF